MPTLTIDGRQLTVPDGTTILQAALASGIEIPYYCYHPALSIAGNCRICLVEVEKFPKPVIACNTAVSEGMVVFTQSEKTKEWERAVMEFLLINHPLDCPICDQAGECKLQEYSFRHGQPTTRFQEEKSHGPKKRDLGPGVVYDWERCIKCTRCIRFCEEVTKTGELGMFLRGVHEEIGTFPGRPLDNPYSGNVVDICPVGALTWKKFRFRSRVWFLTNVPSTCAGCARGCSIDVGAFRNEVYRITPRLNQAVNRWWICDAGRDWAERLNAPPGQRLSGARFTRQDDRSPWTAAVEEAAETLASGATAGKVAVLASPRATVEELLLLSKIARGPLGGAAVYLPAHETGADDELLIRRDRAPNRRGAETVLAAVAGGARPTAELEQRLVAGEVDTLLALGPGLAGRVDDEPPVLGAEALARLRHLVVLDAFRSPLSDAATLLLPVTAWGESAGTYVNFAGRLQWAAAALAPQANCRPAFVLLGDLFGLLTGGSAPARHAVQAALSAEIPAFAAIDWDALPASSGQDLAGADAASAAPPPTGAAEKLTSLGVPAEGR